MASVHFILQKKGGVGKSLVAAMWYQFLAEKGLSVHGLDTDPSNHTFSGFKELGIAELNILNAAKDIEPRMFDVLVEAIYALDTSDHLVIDSGSSCFVPLLAYLTESDAFNVILEGGHAIFIHVPVTGGSDLIHTTASLEEMVGAFPTLPFIVWKNKYHGELIYHGKDDEDDIPFENFISYKKVESHVVAVVEMPLKKKETFGKDIEMLLAKKHSFQEAINSSLPMMVRQRLKSFWSESSLAMEKALKVVVQGEAQGEEA